MRFLQARFLKQVEKTPTCWLWLGEIVTSTGYGRCYKHNLHQFRAVPAHRWAWIIFKGPIPEGLWVLHKCDNRRCVRPGHLFLGTAADNNKDKVKKGRAHTWTKIKHHSDAYKQLMSRIMKGRTVSELTRQKISAAHKGRKATAATRRALSISHMGIKQSTATKLKRRNTWAAKRKAAGR